MKSDDRIIYADLHTHSHYSDGANTPKKIVALARKKSIKALAISDHDNIEGQKEFIKEANDNQIIAIPAVEITTSINKVRIHILGYFMDMNNKALMSYLNALSKARTVNTQKIFERLCNVGEIDYSWGKVLKYNEGRKWISSLHVYNAMKADKLINQSVSWLDFYFKYFSEKNLAYVDIDGFFPEDAIDYIKKAGGISIVAHPKLIHNDQEVEKMIKHGVDGIEVYYPAHTKSDILKYKQMAQKNNLIITGGSDFHGKDTGGYGILGEKGLTKEEFNNFMSNRKN